MSNNNNNNNNIDCQCGRNLFDGEVGKFRLLKRFSDGFKVKCKHCKQWVKFPIVLQNH